MDRRLKAHSRYLLLASLLALLISACGAESPESEEADEEDSVEDPQPSPDAPEEPEDADEDEDEDEEISITADTPEEIYEQLSQYAPEERDAYINERAHEEGRLTIYSTTAGARLEARAEAFMEAYPDIQVDFIRADTGELVERLTFEHRAGHQVADLVGVAGAAGALLNDQGMFANHHGVPVPENWPSLAYGDWWVATDFNPELIVWNTDLVDPADAPSSYEDLLDPKWAGQVAIRDYPENLIVSLSETRGPEAAEEYIRAFIEDQGNFVRIGVTNGATLLAAGEFPIHSSLLATTFIPRMIDDGAPLDFVHADPFPVGIAPEHIYVDAPNPYAALLYIQFMVSEEGQQVEANGGRLVFHPDVDLQYAPYEDLRESLLAGDALGVNADMAAQWADTADDIIQRIVEPVMSE